MLQGIGTEYTGNTRIKTGSQKSSQSCFLKFLIISPLPGIIEICSKAFFFTSLFVDCTPCGIFCILCFIIGSINIIRIISGTDHPVKRFKVLTVGTLRGRFCLSWFREYKICVSSTVFHCYTYDFFHHLVSFCILGFHTVCSLGITAKQNHICTI